MRTLLAVFILFLLIAVPLVVNDQLRLDIAWKLHLVPGDGAEKLAEGDDGAVLIITAQPGEMPSGTSYYAVQADYIARQTNDGMELTDIETDEQIAIPLQDITHMASDDTGEHILLRGTVKATGKEGAVLVTPATNSADLLPAGQLSPDLPGNWDLATWDLANETCDRVSPTRRFIACFRRPGGAAFLAGSFQINVQRFGVFADSGEVFRGPGFIPMVGFAHNDEWLYLQNETGIYRIQIPQSILDRIPPPTPTASPVP